jgi:hypothetical protein
MPRSTTRWLATFALLLASLPSVAGFYYVREGQIVRLAKEIDYLVEDPKSPRTFDDVSRAKEGWISQRDKPFSGPTGPVALWIRFDIPANTPERLFVNVPLFDHEDFYVVRDGALVGRQKGGGLLKWSERSVAVTMLPNSSAWYFAVDAPKGTRTTVYGHLTTDNRYASADLLAARI